MKTSIATSSRQLFVFPEVTRGRVTKSETGSRIIPFPAAKVEQASLTERHSSWEEITFIALGVSGLGGVVLAFWL